MLPKSLDNTICSLFSSLIHSNILFYSLADAFIYVLYLSKKQKKGEIKPEGKMFILNTHLRYTQKLQKRISPKKSSK